MISISAVVPVEHGPLPDTAQPRSRSRCKETCRPDHHLTHGRTGLRRALIGSVAEGTVRHAVLQPVSSCRVAAIENNGTLK